MANDNTQNFHSDLGSAFSSDSMTVVFGQGRFVLDFKKTAPRVDHIGGEQQQTVVMEHQPIVIQPEAAKALLEILESNVEKYEEQFGEIELPEQDSPVDTESATEDHGYIG